MSNLHDDPSEASPQSMGESFGNSAPSCGPTRPQESKSQMTDSKDSIEQAHTMIGEVFILELAAEWKQRGQTLRDRLLLTPDSIDSRFLPLDPFFLPADTF
jgi:hypothetical protein